MDIELQPKTFKVIKVDGTESVIHEKASLEEIYKRIGCECIDTVTLTRRHGQAEIVMCVDDVGMIDGKPVNRKATELYHAVCKPGAQSIHGDVAIVWDQDFE